MGALFIEETSLEEIEIPCLCKITGPLIIDNNPRLRSLKGLSRVERVEGYITIRENPLLETLVGLPSHASFATDETQSLTIRANGALESLVGLPSFDSMPGHLEIIGNDSLVSLEGLPPSLTHALAVRIYANDVLDDLSALPGDLAVVEEELFIWLKVTQDDAGALPRGLRQVGSLRLGGFGSFIGMPEELEGVGGDMELLWNPKLQNLDGLGGITSVEGRLRIADNPDLADLRGLAEGLVVAGGFFIESNNSLYDLSGLPDGLHIGHSQETGESLHIADNPSLTSLGGLPPSVTSVLGDITISGNPALTDLSGLFDNLSSIGGALDIVRNDGLTSLEGPGETLTLGAGSLNSSLRVEGNAALESLQGLPKSMISVPGSISVVDNDLLLDLSGLESIEMIGGDLLIGRRYTTHLSDPCNWSGSPAGNMSLQSLSGLEGLASVGGTLAVACNPSLSEVGGLGSLATVGEHLLILSNPELSSLADLGGTGGALISLGASYQVLCSPMLNFEVVIDVIAEVAEEVSTVISLSC